MCAWPVLLRLLLSAVLLLNVSGAAIAAAKLHAHAATPVPQQAAGHGCHEDGAGMAAPEQPAPAPAPDCCGSGDCSVCTANAHPLPLHPATAPQAWPVAFAAPGPLPVYPDAARQRLIRPPIV